MNLRNKIESILRDIDVNNPGILDGYSDNDLNNIPEIKEILKDHIEIENFSFKRDYSSIKLGDETIKKTGSGKIKSFSFTLNYIFNLK